MSVTAGGIPEPLNSKQSARSTAQPAFDSGDGVGTQQATPSQSLSGLSSRAARQADAPNDPMETSAVGSLRKPLDVFAQATESVRAALRRASDAPPEISDRFAAILAGRSRAAAVRITTQADDIAAALILLDKHQVPPRSLTSLFREQFSFGRSQINILREITELVRWCTRSGEFDKLLFRSITGMQNRRGMPAKEDFDALIEWCTDEDGEFDRALLRSVTSMQAGRGMLAKQDFDALVGWCTDEHGELDRSLLRSIAGMQNGRGMLPKEDFDALVGWCTNERGELDRSLLSSITGMQNGRGMLPKANFDALIEWCTDENGTLDKSLLRSITSMQTGRGMLSEQDFHTLVGWCSDEDGKLDRSLLRSITSMQNRKGMLSKPDFDALVDWCTNEDGKLDRSLLRSITNMQRGKGMLSKRDFDTLIGWCTDEDRKLDRPLLRSITSMQEGRGILSKQDFDALIDWCADKRGQLDRSLLSSITRMQQGRGMPSEAEFEGALAIRAEIRDRVQRGDFSTYMGNVGQIRFLKERSDRGDFVPARAEALVSLLEPAWRGALRWSRINGSHERATRVLSVLGEQVQGAGEGPVTPVIDRVRQRVAVDARGEVVDWFGSDGLPRRLQQFSGRLLGYTVALQGDMPVLVLRLKAPLGYAVYSFSAYLRDRSEAVQIEIVMQDGIPVSFRLWKGNERPRTIRASDALLFGERPDVAIRSVSDGELEPEMVAAGPSVEDQAAQQLLAMTLQRVLSARYGQEESEHIVAVFSEFDAWTQDEGLSDEEAYARLDETFGISEADYAGYKSALRELLSAHGLGAQGFVAGDSSI